ncbi:AMP-binding protein [Chondrinema litorale]|uniref:AMP-binding protein n=1 Tax=Chondrinema litorale TaxID=2994555 RepID=UPI0025430817|nr:AMP-binding protein [Chondrinema litorale]UZR95084.1 AMP-binding protein [Chondrinema litorale]
MPHIYIQNNRYFYDKLSDVETKINADYTNAILGFCKKWIENTDTFELHTSGSTGKPKTIQLKRFQLTHSASLTNHFFKLNSSDHFLVCLNTKMVAGMMMLVRGMLANASITVVKPQGNPLAHLPHDTTCNFVALVPLQLENILLKGTEKDKKNLNNMKAVIIGGGPVSDSLQELILQLDCPVYHTYGMTETVSHIALKKLNHKDRSDYYQALDGVEIKTDERECLMIRSTVTENEWIVTNDRVLIENDNQFKWLGRIDFVINSGGIKVQPEIIEKKIDKLFKEHGIYNAFFTTGTADNTLGEKVTLIIEGKLPETFAESTLAEQLKQVCSKYEVPRQFFYIEKFAVTESGKINRKATIRHLNLDH